MSRFVSRAGEQVAELAELSAEAGRLSRGRALFRKGSVSDLAIQEGSVTASVRGSKGDDYEATINTAPAPPGVRREVARAAELGWSVDELIDDGIEVAPREIDLGFDCDCADWDEACKHVVALSGLRRSGGSRRGRVAPLARSRLLGSVRSRVGEREASSSVPVGGRTTAAQTRPRSTDRRTATDAGDRTARLSKLESLLGDTAMRIPTASKAEPSPPTVDPALAEFLGVDTELDPVDVSGIPAVAPLFASVELGPLADLGPELAEAVATITARLEDGAL